MKDIARAVVYILGAALIINLAGIILLSVNETMVPGVLTDSVGYIIIGMLGLLAHGPKQEVQVTNDASDPVPTRPALPPLPDDDELP